jgi:hypothetical protein
MLLRGPLKRVLNSRKSSNSVLIGGGTTAAGGGIRKVAQQVLQSTFTSSSRAFSSLMQSSLRRIAILSGSSGSILTSAAWFSWASDNERRSVSTTAAPPAETPAATSDTKLRVETGAAQIAHPSKRAKGGEDAFFISKDGRAMGVFDGALAIFDFQLLWSVSLLFESCSCDILQPSAAFSFHSRTDLDKLTRP